MSIRNSSNIVIIYNMSWYPGWWFKWMMNSDSGCYGWWFVDIWILEMLIIDVNYRGYFLQYIAENAIFRVIKKVLKMKYPEIKLKVTISGKKTGTILTNSRSVYNVLKDCFDRDTINFQEEFIMLCLNRRNELIGFYRVSKGGQAGTVVDAKIVTGKQSFNTL